MWGRGHRIDRIRQGKELESFPLGEKKQQQKGDRTHDRIHPPNGGRICGWNIPPNRKYFRWAKYLKNHRREIHWEFPLLQFSIHPKDVLREKQRERPEGAISFRSEWQGLVDSPWLMPESKLQREEPADPSERSGIFLSQSCATWNWNRPHAVAFGSQEPNRPKRLAFRRKGTLGCKHSPLVQFGCLGFLRVRGVVVRILSQGCCTDGQCQRSVGVLSVCFASESVVIAAGK